MAPTSTPRVGWEATSTLSGRDSSRARTTFCWLPPDRDDTGRLIDGVRMSNSATRSRAFSRILPSCRLPPPVYCSTWLSTRFSATENVPTKPSRCRSSGTNPRPALMVRAGSACVVGLPSMRMVPPVGSIVPSRADASSVCPLPCTPATQRISPPRTSKETSSTTTAPVSSATVRSSTCRRGVVVCASGLSTTNCTARPTIISASSASVSSGWACPTIRPRRMTVMSSAISRTSRSLWVMKTMARPSSRSMRMTAMSSSISWGVSTAVGSSKMRYFASLVRALRISTRCWMPTGRFSTTESGLTSR